jgi:hypothetical protein
MLVVAGVGTGPYTLDFAAFDVNGNQSNASFAGTVVPGSHFVYQITYSSAAGAQLIVQPPPDTTPPSIAVSASPSVLWPPNNKLVPVTIAGAIVDTGTGVNPSSARYAVVDEYGVVQPSGPVSLDSSGNYSFVIQLMASRFGYDSDGRHYTITISAADYAHNLGAASAVVVVPHNM